MEKDILNIALCEHKVFEFGRAEFIGTLTVSEFYKENHLFYVSDYPEIGPVFVLVQTPEYFDENPFINQFSIFPFLPFSSEEGLSYIKHQLKGNEFKNPSPKKALLKVLKIRSDLGKQEDHRTKLANNE